MAAPLKAILRGSYGTTNLGDDLLLMICHSILRKVCGPDEVGVLPKDGASYLPRLIPGIRLVSPRQSPLRADVLVYGGGTQYYSYPLPHALAHASLPRKVAACVSDPKRLLGFLRRRWRKARPVSEQFSRIAALGVGVGPFVEGSREELAARQLFGTMDFAWVRDQETMDLLRQWGVGGAGLGGDLCFLLGSSADYPALPAGRRDVGRRVGVIVQDWFWSAEGEAYQGPMQQVVKELRRRGFEVSYMSLCSCDDAWWRKQWRAAGEDVLRWDPLRQAPTEFLATLAGFDCLVATRYHAAVLGAVLGKPVVCVELAQKHRSIARALSDGELLWRFPFASESCVALVEAAFADHGRFAEKGLRAAAGQVQLAGRMVDAFLRFMREALPA